MSLLRWDERSPETIAGELDEIACGKVERAETGDEIVVEVGAKVRGIVGVESPSRLHP
jgi:hypothetical protein